MSNIYYNDSDTKVVQELYEHESDIQQENISSLIVPNSVHIGRVLPKQIARITLCGCIHFEINDDMNFIKPTPEQIKNLHDNFCIDVKVFNDDNDIEVSNHES